MVVCICAVTVSLRVISTMTGCVVGVAVKRTSCAYSSRAAISGKLYTNVVASSSALSRSSVVAS
ncbi:hypothetical protein PF006_g31926 [Phytophthora fragariae]|uniref:Secreted protein n=2 Tax=Phytophthora TaxID=4783 RepID=A0A6A3PKV4_9STRA|nr:hypothetical protein PF003_g19924 [Phytophthora fragariae]KAE8957135.1 hypothetical protein PR002_g31265 [Phytophthora rubi]KAE8900836.1 hypothetical protein PF003_g15106 [Phytophthora fragariae]KAE8904869.1 hypothetical protein PF003_g11166 [Phytophthora fragariae]KAE9059279.1 hypothetical protein PF006_g31926 [Phytophthora fragariae]